LKTAGGSDESNFQHGEILSIRLRKQCLAFAFLIALTFPAVSQVNNPAYADYFLVGQFGEICTMCEAIVLCEIDDRDMQYETIPEGGSFMLYHLQTRTFWSQVATIWEWFITNFNSDSLASSGHRRPIEIYTVTDGAWSEAQTLEAHVSLDPATIVVGEYTIDRVERRWIRDPGTPPVGFCQRLPLWESLDIIAAHRPAEDSS
jgi:hypothetical protein